MYRNDSGNGNGTASHPPADAYTQYLVNGNAAEASGKQQRRAGKEWLPYSGQRQLIIAIDLGSWTALAR